MLKRTWQALFISMIALALGLGACQPATVSPLSATLSELQGTVGIKAAGAGDFSPASGGATLQPNGQVKTGDDGRARLDLSSGTIIRVAPSSLFTLASNESAEGGLITKLKLEAGKIFIILNGGSMDVETPSGVASVRGSYMSVLVNPETLDVFITCLEGDCGGENSKGSEDATDGEKIILFHCDAVTGDCRPPDHQDMTDDDFEDWLKNNPEAAEILNQAHGTMTALAATTEAPATEAPAEATPTPEGGSGGEGSGSACVNIIGPPDGSELNFNGPVTYSWDEKPGAAKYILTFHYPNGLDVQFETTETNVTRYIETMMDAGAYSWDVTALDESGAPICKTEPATFEKPSSHPEDLVDPKPANECDPCDYMGACYDPYLYCGGG